MDLLDRLIDKAEQELSLFAPVSAVPLAAGKDSISILYAASSPFATYMDGSVCNKISFRIFAKSENSVLAFQNTLMLLNFIGRLKENDIVSKNGSFVFLKGMIDQNPFFHSMNTGQVYVYEAKASVLIHTSKNQPSEGGEEGSAESGNDTDGNYKIEIDITPEKNIHTWAPLQNGITGISHRIYDKLERIDYTNESRWTETEIIGGQYLLKVSGERISGDSAQDFILHSAFRPFEKRKTYCRIKSPSGNIVEGAVTAANICLPSGQTAERAFFSFELHFNGKPLYK